MDKELLKGLMFLFGVVVLAGAAFFAFSDGAADKAECIARALKNGTAHGNIDKTCNLSGHR